MSDARFEDGADRVMRLTAQDVEDLQVISTLVQDAVLQPTDVAWRPKSHKFALLINRFRWEVDAGNATSAAPPERVRAVLEIADVVAIRSQGYDRKDADLVLSLLAIDWQQGSDGTGRLTLMLAGDGAIALDVECLNLTLTDVTRPYVAPSGLRPNHPA